MPFYNVHGAHNKVLYFPCTIGWNTSLVIYFLVSVLNNYEVSFPGVGGGVGGRGEREKKRPGFLPEEEVERYIL